MKTCKDCKLEKEDFDFHKSKNNKNGLSTACKFCYNIRNQKSKTKISNEKKQQNLQKRRDTYKKDNKIKEYSRIWKQNKRKFDPNWNTTNKRVYRARKYGAGGSHTEKQWQELLKQCNYQCVCCMASTKLTRDHITPVTSNGSDNIENIQPLCKSCNSSKGNRKIIDYRKNINIETIINVSKRIVTCLNCKIEFETMHQLKKFCSPKCKIIYYNNY